MSSFKQLMSSLASDVAQGFETHFAKKDGSRELDWSSMLMLLIGMLCVVLPLELGQVTFAVVGAVVYISIQSLRKSTKQKVHSKSVKQQGKLPKVESYAEPRSDSIAPRDRPYQVNRPQQRENKKVPKPEFRQPSAQPVQAPTFRGGAFDAQVQELLRAIAPTAQGDRVMKQLAAAAKESLRNFLPEAEVVAFASADITRGTAFGVAVPEVDIILNATPDVLADRLQRRSLRPLPHAMKLDAWKLQKSALRACTDELVAGGVFKFRRSAFKGMEPKVTLLVSGFSEKAIPVDFSVNTATPLYNAALLTECGQRDPCTRDLILLVRRWAKDRGVSHAAKGHLSPYSWTLLAIYFTQVRSGSENSVLKELQCLAMSTGEKQVSPRAADHALSSSTEQDASHTKVASLFKEFFHFYTSCFDWRNEAISVRAGSRGPPSSKLPLHIVVLEDGRTGVAPSIEDPFEPKRNLGSLMTAPSLARLREEFARAEKLCVGEASLSELLEPWVPPERGTVQEAMPEDAASSGEA